MAYAFLEKLMENLEDDEFDMVATLAQRIWLHRNSIIRRGDFTPPSYLLKIV
jgi:hypothetical protein